MNSEQVKVEFFTVPDRPEVCVRAYFDLQKLASEKIFVEYFVNTLAKSLADKITEQIWEEFSELVDSDLTDEVSKLVAKELFPKVLKEIDVQTLLNSVLLASGKKLQKELTA